MAKSLGDLYIDGHKGTKIIGGRKYRLKVWRETKREAEKTAEYVRGKGESARIVPSTYKGRKVYLIFHG